MPTSYEKLSALLKELFQLDQADLDFGIYRIMNQKRDEITRFLDHELLPQVKAAFDQYRPADKKVIEGELQKAILGAQTLGMDPDLVPKVKEIREQLATYAVDTGALENEVYSHLYSFFRRYYDNGDFISMRRYKEGVYAIPYEGEEVKLHWANADQYYVKTTENFRDYAFRLPSGRLAHFKIVEAETEKDNVKVDADKERRFILAPENPIVVEGDTLILRFEYRADPEKRDQKTLNALAVEAIQATAPADWSGDVQKLAPSEANPRRSLLEKHLADYTARNTFDYFIHKDLGGFLRRELDFYIKNEVMRLDDIEHENAPRVEQYLSKIKALRQIAHKIIEFLAQIEDFQKKLWLKKKFVVETHYCITLDRIPEALYPDICANDAQREEWVRLFAIDEITGKQPAQPELGATPVPGFSVPLTVEFLKTNTYLVLDTKFFDGAVVCQMLANFENFENSLNGLLIHSDNFQAIQLLQRRYHEQIKCIYIDPPYNTSEETFVYKNNYRHSSWMSMIDSRITSSKNFLSIDGALLVTIDDEELYHLKEVASSIFPETGYIGTIVIQSNPRGRGINSYYATSHEYCLVYGANPDLVEIVDQPLTQEQIQSYGHGEGEESYRLLPFRRSGGLSTPDLRPNSEFPLYYSLSLKKIVAVGAKRLREYPAPYESQLAYIIGVDNQLVEVSIEELLKTNDIVTIMPTDSNGQRRVWRWSDRQKILLAAAVGDFIVKNNQGDYNIQLKDWIKGGRKPKTIWIDSKYDSSSHGTNLLINILGRRGQFGYPKSVYSTQDAIHTILGNSETEVCLDYFAGSGTTGHAIINLNRTDGGTRKYILVEMGNYFETVTKPRIQKVIYSKDWKDGKPVSREGSSHCFKYLRLESYEDALNNLTLRRTQEQQLALEANPEFKENYLLSYMLDVESQGSLLNIQSFVHPFNYQLNIATGAVSESKSTNIDLVETFNYLIGLRVQTLQNIRGFRVVTGLTPAGDRTLIIWRDLEENNNAALEEFFRKQDYNPRDMEFDLIYVNGDNNLENLRRPDETWKVRLIEEDFLRLMFDSEGL